MDGFRWSRRWFLTKCTVLTVLAGGLLFGILRLFRSEPTEEYVAQISTSLRKIAAAVLPSEVPAEEAQRAIDGFLAWLRLYREGIELVQFIGYGTPRKTALSPLGRYQEQLRQLETSSVRQHGQPLASLEPADMRALVFEALEKHQESRGAAQRRSHRAGREEHVVRSFLSFYFRSDDGINRCYRAVINPRSCRWWGSDDRPASLPS